MSMPPSLAAVLLAAKTDDEVDDAFDQIFGLVNAKTLSTEQRIDEILTPSGNLAQRDSLLDWIASPEVASALHTDILLTCLRLNAVRRASFPSWSAALDAVRCELEHRGENVSALLHGMQEEK